jgi:hypothetical protein
MDQVPMNLIPFFLLLLSCMHGMYGLIHRSLLSCDRLLCRVNGIISTPAVTLAVCSLTDDHKTMQLSPEEDAFKTSPFPTAYHESKDSRA